MKKIYIMGSVWTLHDTKKTVYLDGVEVYGYCDYALKELHVAKNEEYFSTLIHEMIHAILWESGLNNAKINNDIEEVLCEVLSRQLARSFKLKLIL